MDAKLRELERAAAAGDEEAAVQLALECVRSGIDLPDCVLPDVIWDLEMRRDPDGVANMVHEIMASQARGSYQRNLVYGVEAWSGGSLRGAAASYGASYARSRRALIERINAALPPGLAMSSILFPCGSPRRQRRIAVVWTPNTRLVIWSSDCEEDLVGNRLGE